MLGMTGILLLFLTCVAFAGYSVLARSILKNFTLVETSYFILGVGLAVFLVSSVTVHMIAGSLDSFLSPLANVTFITTILYLGLLASLFTTLSTNYILSRITATKMSVFANLSTIFSIAAGAIFLAEKITFYHIIGSLLIITGVIGTNYFGQYKWSLRKGT